ncbi:MAG: archease [Candidatus Diapherotrites archaeon]
MQAKKTFEKYRYLEHTADALFLAFGRTDREMISNSAEAMANVMYDLSRVKASEREAVSITAKDLEELVHKFLEEILFRITAREKLYSFFGVNSLRKDFKTGMLMMEAELRGEKIDAERHLLKKEIKAVTWNRFMVEKKGALWVAQVLVDI